MGMTNSTNTNTMTTNEIFTIFTPYGNKVATVATLKEAIQICDEKSEDMGAECFVEDKDGDLIYETYIGIFEC